MSDEDQKFWENLNRINAITDDPVERLESCAMLELLEVQGWREAYEKINPGKIKYI